MCGITGIVSFEERSDLKDQIQWMTETLYLRGPDSHGYFVDPRVCLGHRRLAIIDLENGQQPIFNEDQTVVVVLNGEIYNYKTLRETLQGKGHHFTTQTDTEVIVHAYEEWGIEKTLNCLDGMFAIGLHDKNLNKTLFARDKFGEKPLYYFQEGTKPLYVASELKALETQGFSKDISKDGLNLFLSLSYIPAPYTIYQQVKKLEAGHFLEVCEREVRNICYYRLEDHIKPTTLTYEEAREKLRTLLDRSVKERMVSDVPLGAFLSGGIDSSGIVAMMAQSTSVPIRTFSIGFKEKEFDESDRAKLIADTFQTEHTLHFLDYEDVSKTLDEIIHYFDEPFGDSSFVPSYYVAKLAKEKVKVVLTGDCADELFGGYEKYLASYYAKRYQRIPKWLRALFESLISLIPHTRSTNKLLRKIKKVIQNSRYRGFDLAYQYMCIGCTDQKRKEILLKENWVDSKTIVKQKYDRYPGTDLLNQNMFSDVLTVLEGNMFPKVDRCCMMNSLESRPPFLSSEIVEFALSLPSNYKVNQKNKKRIVKDVFGSILPSKTLRFKKSGFSVPVGYWICNELRGEISEMLDEKLLVKQGLFNRDTMQNIFEKHLRKKENNAPILWNFYIFQRWYCKKFPETLS